MASDERTRGTPRRKWLLIVALVLFVDAIGGWLYYRYRREHSQDAAIHAAAARYGVDGALVKAVVWRESWFDPNARGKAGEIGLMQIREPAAREWAEAERIIGFHHEHILDPGSNTLCGVWYLAKLLRRYPQTDDPLPYALADYNAGRGNVLKWNQGAAATNSQQFLAQMTFPGTRRYIETVVQRRARYQDEFAPTTR
ncbi:MAG: lytic transglycosylase domain-containing protein [Limisphaerales bacterium]